jgi:hypothetical protein
MMELEEEFAVWINPYPGSSGYVLKTFDNHEAAKVYAAKHPGIKKHGGRVERTVTTRSVVIMLDPEVKKVYFPHGNRMR